MSLHHLSLGSAATSTEPSVLAISWTGYPTQECHVDKPFILCGVESQTAAIKDIISEVLGSEQPIVSIDLESYQGNTKPDTTKGYCDPEIPEEDCDGIARHRPYHRKRSLDKGVSGVGTTIKIPQHNANSDGSRNKRVKGQNDRSSREDER